MVSRGGRIVLAKTVLNSILVFFMQLERFLTKIHNEIDKVVCRCVWGEMGWHSKMRIVSKETLCRPRNIGGFSLHKASCLNKALLTKLARRTMKKDEGSGAL